MQEVKMLESKFGPMTYDKLLRKYFPQSSDDSAGGDDNVTFEVSNMRKAMIIESEIGPIFGTINDKVKAELKLGFVLKADYPCTKWIIFYVFDWDLVTDIYRMIIKMKQCSDYVRSMAWAIIAGMIAKECTPGVLYMPDHVSKIDIFFISKECDEIADTLKWIDPPAIAQCKEEIFDKFTTVYDRLVKRYGITIDHTTSNSITEDWRNLTPFFMENLSF